MTDRIPLEVSSTSGKIHQYIEKTGLGELIMGSVPQETVEMSVPDSEANGETKPKIATNITTDIKHINFNGNSTPLEDSRDFEYLKKIKYLPNKEFDPDLAGKSFHLSLFLPPNSIPNTFKYKSHPNARTKLSLRASKPGHVIEENSDGNEDFSDRIIAENASDLEVDTPADQNINNINTNTNSENDIVNSGSNNGLNKDSGENENIEPNSNAENLNIDPNIHPDEVESSISSPIEHAEFVIKRNLTDKRSIPKFSSIPNSMDESEIRTSTVKENITPNWMPDVLNEKWLPPGSLKFDSHDEFSSSVRINKPKEFELNLYTSADTMIHNSQVDANETPEWERANRAYQERKLQQPDWKNIFSNNDLVTTDKRNSVGNNSNNNLNNPLSDYQNQTSSSVSSQLHSFNEPKKLGINGSKPMSPQILQRSNEDLKHQQEQQQQQDLRNEQFQKDFQREVLDNYPKGGHIPQPYSTQKLQKFDQNPLLRNPESPLKLFHDKYNTFTKERLNDILQKVQNESPAISNTNKNLRVDSLNLSKEFEMPKLIEPKLRIKNFTKNGEYTAEQFYKNADDLFKNVQEKYKNRKPSMRDVTNLHGLFYNTNSNSNLNSQKQLTSNSTTTSTPKNEKVENISDLVATISDDYSSYTSGVDSDDDENQLNHLRNSDVHIPTNVTNNEYTSFESSGVESNKSTEKKLEVNNQLSPRNLQKLQRQLTQLSESSDRYTSDDYTENAFEENEISRDKEIPNLANQVPYDQMEVLVNRLQKLELAVSENKKGEINELQKENDFLKDELVKLQEELNSKQKLNPSHENYFKEKDLTLDEKEITVDSYEFSVAPEDATHLLQFIKWKRPSQMVLGNSPDNTKPGKSVFRLQESLADISNIYRGRVDPGINLPLEYDDMIFDSENNKWIRNQKSGENIAEVGGSLDSIEDLISNSNDERHHDRNSISKSIPRAPTTPNGTLNSALRGKGSASKNKPEVSFHLPYDSSENISYDNSKRHIANVTNVSQLQDSTFSQSKKKIVNILTDFLNDTLDWNLVKEIDISNREIESISELKNFLPNLTTINASNNNISFLEGVSSRLLNVNLSNNHLESITSFKSLSDLQNLNISFNNLTSISNLRNNIHITVLIANNNKIKTFDGLENLTNLVKLDISLNELSDVLDLSKFNFKNLQQLNVSENRLISIVGVESLPNLRILNANENDLESLPVNGKHLLLKKLLLKFNRLKELKVESFPSLRELQIDGNLFERIDGLKYSKYIERLSCKSQYRADCVETLIKSCSDIITLDLSGNNYFFKEFNSLMNKPFLNLNNLTLTAMNITNIPENFQVIFPNVRELNLNFNRIENIDVLNGMVNLRRVYLLSNRIENLSTVVTGLSGSRNSLKILDLRLNPLNVDIYPFVFNEQELEYSRHIKSTTDIDLSPIPLETLEDIENFAILYQTLSKNLADWEERDTEYIKKLSSERRIPWARLRIQYETLLINFFHQLKYLDGNRVTIEKKSLLKEKLKLHKK